MTVSDVLLEWMSELGAGDWDEARRAIASLQVHQEQPRRAWEVASDLMDSGHIEVDWQEGRWSVAEPALCLLPGTGLCAVWTGARPRRWQRRLIEQISDIPTAFDFTIEQPSGPTARFVKVRAFEDLERICDTLQLRLVVDPATCLARALARIEAPTKHAARPLDDERVQWLDPNALTWRTMEGPGHRTGLFMLERSGRRVGRWRRDDGEWYELDLAEGTALALRDSHEPMLRWSRASLDLAAPSILSVRRPLMLPALCRRVAIASSGLLPSYEGQWFRYLNVTHENARAIAASLGLALAEGQGRAGAT